MKIVVTGSVGHISKPLTQALVAQGHAVTVISSQPDRHADIEALGARAAIGSLEDPDFLTTTFTGADSVYAMVPPAMSAPDVLAYYRSLGHSYAQAIQRAGVRRVVHLSSWGADLSEGTGFILGSHQVEGILNELSDVALTHLRAGSFYYNLYGFVGMIKHAGFIASNYGDEDVVVLAAPVDIAAAAAEELTTTTTGITVRYVASDERTATDIARVLGQAIGRPDLKWITLSDDQTKQGLEQSGLPTHLAASYVELGASIHNGAMRQGYLQNPPRQLGNVKIEDFANEFAAAF
ncbi:NAD(P)H-binding protein (plasmid) [Hymenobacter tibetensis]|uniref:NAD(P)H-binding protein n=1 Tax=Hymenobacter tibetensis TaxID=497967 RepID=A0ABY4D4V3_9BACT|nr:NAD(P)H-binding protein [Hymenobacter tibetensis]UOG77530.1 NAD(P)H-binding protein [Hymenobacter tibetensis]